jgi:hypothetical protein
LSETSKKRLEGVCIIYLGLDPMAHKQNRDDLDDPLLFRSLGLFLTFLRP